MNRRRFLSMLAALPIVGKVIPKSQPPTAAKTIIRQFDTVYGKGIRIPAYARPLPLYSFSERKFDASLYDMYIYPTKRLDLQIVDATTPDAVPDSHRREPEPAGQ